MKRIVTGVLIACFATFNSAQNLISTEAKNVYHSELNVFVKRLIDDTKTDISAAKLTWHPKKQAWVKQIVLYNNFPNSEKLDKQLNYVLSIKVPSDKGARPWEGYKQKFFQ